MDANTETLALPPSALHSPRIACEALAASSSLPIRPLSPPSPCPVPASSPLSPLTPSYSIPFSPASFPPSAQDTRPAPTSADPPPPPKVHCPGLAAPSDQDDLTCLSWLHQRGDLLTLLPLPRTTPLPQLTHQDSSPSPYLPSSPSKPPYSFSSLIFMAIEDSPEKRLPVKGIYDWIVSNFPYYRAAPGGWRNSVRHNLSLSKSFRRIHREKGQKIGKGSLWCVCPEYRPALLEVLRKTHHCHNPSNSFYSSPLLLEGGDCGPAVVCDTVEISGQFLPFAVKHSQI
uniref:Si:ch211-145o7.3 n=1 Tax=Scleropages formosus TaxID=113540 RepID=A0A8C9RG10_SCLFO